MYLNKAQVIGNLTRDPELKALPSGIKVSSMSVATNRIWKNKEGVKQEAADYHNVVVFGRQAETCAQYLKKGSQVLVEGRLQTRSWEDKDQKKQYRTEIVAENIQFGARNDKQVTTTPTEETQQVEEVSPMTSEGFNGEVINTEDIPF